MKAVGGILSGIVLALLLVLVVSTITYLMNVAYDQQLTQESYVNDFISSPKAFQVGSSTIVSNGPLDIKYVIYPNGKIDNLSQPFDGRVDLSSLPNGWPWVYVVLSNGQAFNISQPQPSTSSNISLLYLESQVPYYADYPLNPWNVSTYDQIITKGLMVNPAHNPTILQDGETIAWNAFGKGTVAVIPVHTGNGWLNFTASIPGWYDYGFGILLQNGTDGTGHWIAITVGFNNNAVFVYEVFGPPGGQYIPTILYYNFTATNVPWGFNFNTFTLRVAMHFQEGEPAELYMWWLDGSQWVPVEVHTWVPNATGAVVGGEEVCYVGGTPVSHYSWTDFKQYETVSFPAYIYTIYNTTSVWGFISGAGAWITIQTIYQHLGSVNLVPGSNVIIVPQSKPAYVGYVYVYNITSTI